MTTAAVRAVGVLSYDPNLKTVKILLLVLSCTGDVMVLGVPLGVGACRKPSGGCGTGVSCTGTHGTVKKLESQAQALRTTAALSSGAPASS